MSLIQQPTRRRARFHDLTVSRVDRLTDQAVAISFEIPEELREEFEFEPGQHLTVRATIDGQDARRSYSCCISRAQSRERGEVRVATATVPGGLMSTWLNEQARPGDTMQVMSPMGSFTCPTQPTATRHHVGIAAGSGITPVLSLLTTALEEEPHSRVTLVFGNRRTDSVMFLEELMDLKNRFPGRFTLLNVLSREPQEAELLTGRIDREKVEQLMATFIPEDQVDEWYLCGPFGMVETVQEVLAERGVDAEHVHHEIFHVDGEGAPVTEPVPAEPADPGAPPEAVATVTLDGRTTTVPMPSAAETILAATLRERPDAPFSCTGGVCGTCRAKVTDGEVRMDRNYALEPDEVDRGYRLMCQSHPVTEAVTIDYDA
ncbi:Phenylacetate-CoA oxygenase/reductase, PaaK subunit [Serinicoccus hydrothermalis]|uniref:Phenylacetate-CoA oxygenase/reductase, PaaK subunit n=1 Tax=Serinicoccus hydrothermalis TaxID=1758689 RepID=A0A1B1NAK0_9MICO|nr:1,2-phenylacetyl-CoA epoxidase subunit PaaE [Serinicoccus hydrothermalis]ANS78459.1 Phenylacetate-CoA oxygenase/reductase, PaaK subunit [Serinicoccus hydrothermalis]